MTQFQGLGVLCDPARKLTCTALLWRKMVPRFVLFQGSNRRSSAALFIKHKLLKTVCSLVLMSTQAIFITAAGKKSVLPLPLGLVFSLLAQHSCLTWSLSYGVINLRNEGDVTVDLKGRLWLYRHQEMQPMYSLELVQHFWEICSVAFLMRVRWEDRHHSDDCLVNIKLPPVAVPVLCLLSLA